jgi:hypothetical protein
MSVIPSIAGPNPNVHYAKFRSAIMALSIGQAKSLAPQGAFGLVADGLEWTAYNQVPATPGSKGVPAEPAYVLDRPDYPPVFDENLPAEPTAKDLMMHKTARKNNLIWGQAEVYLKTHILIAIGPDIERSITTDRISGLSLVPCLEIMARLHAKYGVLGHNDIKALKVACSAGLTDPNKFDEYARDLQTHLGIMLDCGHPASKFDEIDFLRTGLESHKGLTDSLMQYFITTPALSDQNLTDAISFLTAQRSNWLSHIPAYSNSAQLPRSALLAAPLPPTATALELRMDALAAAVSAFTAPKKTAPAAPHTAPKRKLYCFRHGTGGHTGIECKEMLTFNPNAYTLAMRQASSQCTLSDPAGQSLKGAK